MESGITNESKNNVETENVANTDSADSFESFIYDLFEKNGILNDVRAYLRGHIVDVLKSAQTGKKLLKKSLKVLKIPFVLFPGVCHSSDVKRNIWNIIKSLVSIGLS